MPAERRSGGGDDGENGRLTVKSPLELLLGAPRRRSESCECLLVAPGLRSELCKRLLGAPGPGSELCKRLLGAPRPRSEGCERLLGVFRSAAATVNMFTPGAALPGRAVSDS
jgi:hypothetical protein